MRYLEEIEMRRLVLAMEVNTPQAFCIADTDPAKSKKKTIAFARTRNLPVAVDTLSDGIVVTRVAGWPKVLPRPPRANKRWDLDGLAKGERLIFTVSPAEHHKLRLAASQKGKVTGWTIRCRIQDDGTMVVYRTDAGAIDSGAAGSIEA